MTTLAVRQKRPSNGLDYAIRTIHSRRERINIEIDALLLHPPLLDEKPHTRKALTLVAISASPDANVCALKQMSTLTVRLTSVFR